MKKFASIFISLIMIFALCVPALAANETANFLVNVISESDSQAFISIDYNGGQTFNCLDFEVKLSERVSVKSCVNGAGLRNFKIYVDDLNSDALTISSCNKDGNPIKFTFASTLGFKVVNGKDILTLTLTKNSAAKLTSDDVKLTITNCGISADDLSTKDIKTSVVQIGNKESSTTLKSPDQVGTAAEKTSTPAPVGEVTSATQETTLSNDETSSSVESSELTPADEKTETEQNDSSSKKKIIIIAAAALCLVVVIAATVIYIAKKTKNEE